MLTRLTLLLALCLSFAIEGIAQRSDTLEVRVNRSEPGRFGQDVEVIVVRRGSEEEQTVRVFRTEGDSLVVVRVPGGEERSVRVLHPRSGTPAFRGLRIEGGSVVLDLGGEEGVGAPADTTRRFLLPLQQRSDVATDTTGALPFDAPLRFRVVPINGRDDMIRILHDRDVSGHAEMPEEVRVLRHTVRDGSPTAPAHSVKVSPDGAGGMWICVPAPVRER